MQAIKQQARFNLPTHPILRSRGRRSRLIRGRECLLQWITGAARTPAINEAPTPVDFPVRADLAIEIKTTLTRLTTVVMAEDGRSVDYAALRTNPAYAAYRRTQLAALRQFDPQQLPSEAVARAFWINLYNALVLDAVIQFDVQRSVIEGALGILAFFRRAAYVVGGQRVSLEDMEHGILRGNRGNPYLPGLHFPARDPRLPWALRLDPRIHFALNCGGRSCPPIRAYTPQKLAQQLDVAARGFVDATTTAPAERNELVISQLFRWYAADFGGKAGVRRFLINHLPDDGRRARLQARSDSLRIRYAPYDWELNLA